METIWYALAPASQLQGTRTLFPEDRVMHLFLAVALGYLFVNFVMALLLHVHGLRQAHLPLRFLDVLMHFLLLGLLAIPVLLVVSVEAFFGGDKLRGTSYSPMAQHL